ncbi:MAG: S8 family serine peptidase, partial [Pseudomonadota bacterium]
TDDLAIAADGTFVFGTPIASGAAYAVTVFKQPTAPSQTCTVTDGAGSTGSANVGSVSIHCTTNSFSIGGTVSGLAGTGLVLRNNGTDDLAIAADGTFVFGTPIASGAAYAVTVFKQPTAPSQTCTVTGGTGNVGNTDVGSLSVNCVNTFTIGGTVSGLAGTGLVLRNNGRNALRINGNGAFTFSAAIATNTSYTVTVFTQPTNPSQNCTLTNASGRVDNANVSNVSVNCTTNSFSIGGTVSGLTGTGLVLRNNGTDDLAINGSGAFTFTTPILSGTDYAVTVSMQPLNPAQLCTVTGGSGTVGAANVTQVNVSCGTSDPLFVDQWHLQNTGQAGGTVSEDVDVLPVWNATPAIKGTGVRIAIVDDGLQIAHEDLSPNVVAGQSHNYVNGTTDPTPTGANANHGTAVGGVAAARDLNDLGGAGAAPRASLVGYNLLQDLTTANEVDAMTRNAAAVSVSNNSWGAPDDGRWAASASTWRSAIDTGTTTGRGGKGILYTWAAGNGGSVPDNSNYDGQANYHGVLAICAVGDDGIRASYSERGANLWVCTPSEGRAGHAITTTDRTGAAGYNDGSTPGDYANANYTNTFNGTSSAAPLAAGVIALVLEANPNLGWRDLRLVLAQSARQNHPTDTDWIVNGAGFNINHNYGFGVADASAAVALAQTWVNVGPELVFSTATATVNASIPDNDSTGIADVISVAGSGIGKIEFVEITFNGDHTYVGDLEISLTAPSGTTSRLSELHACAGGCLGVPDNSWRFGSARHLAEAADGNWTLRVSDLAANDTGTFASWRLTFYGRAN